MPVGRQAFDHGALPAQRHRDLDVLIRRSLADVHLFLQDEALLDEFRGRLNLIPGLEFGPESLRRRPSIKPQTLRPAAAQEAFLDALEWFLRTVQEDDRTS